MLSNRPYLLRAFYQWIVDSSCTPLLAIDANHPRVKAPKDYVEGGEIVFNISAVAVRDLKISNEAIEFKASFSGVIHIIYVPIRAVLAIYAEENGEGLFVDAEEDEAGTDTEGQAPTMKGIDGGRSLEAIDDSSAIVEPKERPTKPFLKLVE